MTPLRESFVLPCLFLTVALLGGLRLGAPGVDVRLVPPPLVSLVLAVLPARSARPLARLRAGPSHRAIIARPLENVSGGVVLLTLFAASAQTFNLLTPDTGLLHVLVSVFFLVQLLTTLTASATRGDAAQPCGADGVRVLAEIRGAGVAVRARPRRAEAGDDGADGRGDPRGARLRADRVGHGLRRIPGADAVPGRPVALALGQARPERATFHCVRIWDPAEPDELDRDLAALRRQ